MLSSLAQMISASTLEHHYTIVGKDWHGTINLLPGPFLENFLGGVKFACAEKMGVAGDRWAWSTKSDILYTRKLWRYGKA